MALVEVYDVVVVGAGIGGISFAYRIQEAHPDLTYCILENRHELGGTWSLFNFPGVRSDSDLYTYSFPWNPWKGRHSIASGWQIKSYIQESASLQGIDKKIKFNYYVERANFSFPDSQWTLQVTVNGAEEKTIRCSFLMICAGYYDYEKPAPADIPGIENFGGTVVHPQFWPQDLDYTGKNVTIIGSGATAITILPAMAEKANHVTLLQRSPSYVLPLAQEDLLDKVIRALTFWNKSLQYKILRLKWLWVSFLLVRLGTWFPSFMEKLLNRSMLAQLPHWMSLDPHFKPAYKPFEQRLCLCPDGDFFAPLRSGKASIETGVIDTITKDTIKLTSGKELVNQDIIVTATGLLLRFGGGISFYVGGEPLNPAECLVWNGVMLEGLPNAAHLLGYPDTSWTMGADATAQLVCRVISMMRDRGYGGVEPCLSEEERKDIRQMPLWPLKSTYVLRGRNVMPKAGAMSPWRPRENYFSDLWKVRYQNIRRGLKFWWPSQDAPGIAKSTST
ncbi:FAD/NAD(P)-binding domain-containing protein [Piedraia hortae CBS 480.64]|uniref:FAD/NAD(P)-binding domain-containing protein n=1 Tax=Piedraia hortae CBS 480.64 TaxID=1314780 RepID=A0A6A7BXK3_9PEZI|nr:FAD/NAD(P)-binding domain-containing protein [Piedraia hortae CBS 480.64]